MRFSTIGIIIAFVLAILASPLPATAQQSGKLPRIAIIFNGAPLSDMAGFPDVPTHPLLHAFFQRLHELGWAILRTVFVTI
jgi:hypothetical protein